MNITAMKQALEELEEINKLNIGENAICLPAEIDGAMDALRQAIEQAEKQEQADQNETTAELRRLHAVNQELLAALSRLVKIEDGPRIGIRAWVKAMNAARTAIAKAGETK
jgi:hypothetical protein